jgi:hypothetical protein
MECIHKRTTEVVSALKSRIEDDRTFPQVGNHVRITGRIHEFEPAADASSEPRRQIFVDRLGLQ